MDIRDKIGVVVVGIEDEKTLVDIFKDVKYVELRIDEFLRNFPEEGIIEWIKKIKRLGENEIIGTIRWYKEAGENPFYIPDRKRLEIYRKIVDYVDFVDIEIKSRIFEKVFEIAKIKNKKVIASYHNFKKTPDYKILRKIIGKGKREGVDYLKIATKINSTKNLFTLLELSYKYSKKMKLVIIPMGVSYIERLIPLFFGSQFTYLSISKKTAPNQPSYSELSPLLKCQLTMFAND